ncbi:MAG: flgG [Rickettsiaceae bacterium]|jgi:flagellar basal-body rod protein FlgG|nr:flgG [Rickettsiaceae bacterium]
MSIALYTAATGMSVAQTDIDVKAHNIANLRTTGFKKFRVETSDLSYQTLRRAGVAEAADVGMRPVGVHVGMGAKVTGVYRILTPGNLENTSNPFDVAIEGPGYFAVILPNGQPGYTRNGSFKVNQDGNLATSDGYVLATNVPIGMTPGHLVKITSDGRVTATNPDDRSIEQEIGRINVYTFINEQGLEPIVSNFLAATNASGEAIERVPGVDGAGTLKQHNKEESNVDPTSELTSLIMAQRAYELNSKVVKTADEVMKSVTDLRP